MALVKGLPPIGTALARSLADNPMADVWSPEAYLTALVVDHLAIANWQRSGDANAKPPQPLPRPEDHLEGDEPFNPRPTDTPERVAAREAYEARMARPETEEDEHG